MQSKLLKIAQDVRALKNLQRQLAISGDHLSAMRIGSKLAPHIERLACGYLKCAQIPQTPAGNLVREIAAEAVLADPNRKSKQFISALSKVMNSSTERNLLALRRAKAQLPNLRKANWELSQISQKTKTNRNRRSRARKRR